MSSIVSASRPDVSARNRRPLVVRFGAVGDTVILTVLIRALHARFGEPVDVVGSGRHTWEILDGQPGVGDVLYLNSRRIPYWLNKPKMAIVRALRSRGVGPAWWCQAHDTRGFDLLERAGWTEEWIASATHCPDLVDPGRRGLSFAEMFLDFAKEDPPALAASQIQAPKLSSSVLPIPQLCVSPAMRDDAERWLGSMGLEHVPFILVQVGNRRTTRPRLRSHNRPTNTKYWPEERWAEVLRGLRSRHPDHALLMLGVPSEAPLNDAILELAKIDRAYNVARDMPLRRLIGLAERAAGMVSVDTGPAHLVAAVGCSMVVLFGKVPPTLYCPRGPGARVLPLVGRVDGAQCMLGIRPDDVLGAWAELDRGGHIGVRMMAAGDGLEAATG
jgi:hypothetical protein